MTLTPNTQITQENFGLLKAGDVREIATSMNLVLSGSWDEAQDRDWSGKGNEAKLDRLDELLGDLLDALDRPALSPPAEGVSQFEQDKAKLRSWIQPITPTPAYGEERAASIIQTPMHLNPASVTAALGIKAPTPAPVDWGRVGRDLDALRYVLNFADEAKQVRTVMSAFTLPERETTAVRLERLYATIKALAAAQPEGK